MTKKTSVIVIGPFPPWRGGIAQHTDRLATEIESSGVAVRRISWSRLYPCFLYPGRSQTEPYGNEVPSSSVERRLAWNNPFGWLSLGLALSTAHGVRIFVVSHHAQLVAYSVVIATSRLAYYLRMLVRRNVDVDRRRSSDIFIVHNVLPHEDSRLSRVLVRLLGPTSDTVVVHTKEELGLASLFGATDVRMVALPLHFGFSSDAVIESSIRDLPPRYVLSFVGFVRPYKGVDLLIEALALAKTAVSIVVAGEFWVPMESLASLARDKAVDDRVQLIDRYISAREMEQVVRGSDALVLPYRSATGSQMSDMAFALGRPVIATPVGAFADKIIDSVNAIVCTSATAEGIADAIDRFYEGDMFRALTHGAYESAGRDASADWSNYLSTVLGEREDDHT